MSIADDEKRTPTDEEISLARDSSRALSKFASRIRRGKSKSGKGNRVRLVVAADGERAETPAVEIPAAAFRLLMDVLNQMAQGNAMTLIPVHAELTTQEAAEILNVSRPFVIKLIDDRQIPHKMVGTHRRVLFQDLIAYKQKIDADRSKVLDELAAEAQDLQMGY